MEEKFETIISKDDINNCLCMGELQPCPFCGKDPISWGKRNIQTSYVVYTIHCVNCNASIFYTDKDANVSRQEVIKLWNRRL